VSSRKKPSKKQKTVTNDETCLHKHCAQWLRKSVIWERLLIFHVANERKGGIGAAMHFKRMGVRPGVADWLAFPPGRAAAIELKDDEGEQSPEQLRFQFQWEKSGHSYFVCRTLEEFQGVISALMLFA
jgi:hypothetical protein